ncbi:MAG: mechanosensitive ion channel family protein [Dictyoglomaceae bacterium]|nr:mechanosensitive ion channel family protein [Dictyoglomaceae bacterium]HPU43059.1 mechanosensitive ion channel family protein [Dictyoglomaceae bacterium]
MKVGESISLWISDLLKNLPSSILSLVIVYFSYKVIFKLVIDAIENKMEKESIETRKKTLLTIKTLLAKLIKYGFVIIAALIILSVFGIETKNILASLGILSLALAFGVQNLVKDLVSGFFLLLDRAINVGDYIEVGSISGIVEDISIRTVKIRAFDGGLYTIPNGQIITIKNYGVDYNMAVANLLFPVSISPNDGISLAKSVSDEIKTNNKNIIEDPQVLGITEYGGGKYKIVVTAKTLPGKSQEIEREFNRIFLIKLEEQGLLQKL